MKRRIFAFYTRTSCLKRRKTEEGGGGRGKDNKIPHTSLLNNFVFEKEGCRIWRLTRLEKDSFTHLMSSCTKSRKKLPLNYCNHLDLEPKAVVQSVRISCRKKTYSLVMRTDVC